MFCNNCGAQLPDGSKFCMNCGSKIPDFKTTVSSVHVDSKESDDSSKSTSAEVTKAVEQSQKKSTPIPTGAKIALIISLVALVAAVIAGFIDLGTTHNLSYYLKFLTTAPSYEETVEYLGEPDSASDGLFGVYSTIRYENPNSVIPRISIEYHNSDHTFADATIKFSVSSDSDGGYKEVRKTLVKNFGESDEISPTWYLDKVKVELYSDSISIYQN